MPDALYTATVTATAGRIASDDGALALEVNEPARLAGPGGTTNPEQLMAGALSSCLLAAVRISASSQDADVQDAEVTAAVTLLSADGPGYTAAYRLEVALPGLEDAAAERVVTEAKVLCPFTKTLEDAVVEIVRV